MKFNSRRSAVHAKNGIVAASQPLAVEAGVEILKKGGNAVDAAIATAACLNVTEPTSCGIGGDMFALFYDNNSNTVYGINGSGRSAKELTLEKIRNDGITSSELPPYHPHTVTVPGAIAGFIDLLERFGTVSRKEVFNPAINLARDGFPVAPITSYFWQRSAERLLSMPNGSEMLSNGKGPQSNQLMKMPNLANTFELIVEHGKAGFYEGKVANAIVDVLSPMGGVLSLDDLKNHSSEFVIPISTDYKNVTVSEIPPNGQGITALIGLNILEEYNFSEIGYQSPKYFHILIEAMRIAFADSRWYVADPSIANVPIKELLSKDYASKRRKLLDETKATIDTVQGSPFSSSDTVYFTTADKEGNACSFIYSNYMGFGTGIVPKNCGFTLQNRGANFSLQQGHPNVLAPNKRPYHTIIPGMATLKDTQELYASFGVMGGFMQPQGHVQVILNMIEYGMDSQEALDAPRFCIKDGSANGSVAIEEGIPVEVMSSLSRMGHTIDPTSGHARAIFGRGQIIKRYNETGIYSAGSDPRADGTAFGY